jgi:hypothetical protein
MQMDIVPLSMIEVRSMRGYKMKSTYTIITLSILSIICLPCNYLCFQFLSPELFFITQWVFLISFCLATIIAIIAACICWGKIPVYARIVAFIPIALILALFIYDIISIKYRESTWQEKIEIGQTEKEVINILPTRLVPPITPRFATGGNKLCSIKLTDGNVIELRFQLSSESIRPNNEKEDLVWLLREYKIKTHN